VLLQTALIVFLGTLRVQDPGKDLELLKKDLQTFDNDLRISPSVFWLPLEHVKTLIPDMTALLKSPEEKGRLKGLLAVRHLYPQGLEGAIRPLLRDPEQSVRWAAIDTICHNRLQELFPALLEVLKAGPVDTRAHAAEALATIPFPAAVPALLTAAQDKEFEVSLAAGQSLGKLRVAQAVPILLGWFKITDDSRRVHAGEALGLIGDRRAIAPLKAWLTDPDYYRRAGACLALGRLGVKEVIPDLVKALSDPGEFVPGDAAMGLALLQAKQHAGAIAKLLTIDKYASQTLLALRILDAKETLPEVLKAIDHSDLNVRLEALETAGRIGGPYALKALRDHFEDKTPWVRAKSTEVFFSVAPLSDIRAQIRERSSDFFFIDNSREDLLRFELNRLKAPMTWDKLNGIRLDGSLIGSSKEIAEAIAKQAGLKLIPPTITKAWEMSWPLGRLEIPNPGNRMTLLDALRALQHVQSSTIGQIYFSGAWRYALERDELRVEPLLNGTFPRDVWAGWLKEFAAKE